MTALNGGIDLLGNAKSNDSKLAGARLHSELGFAETQVNSVERNNWYNGVWGAGLLGLGRFGATAEYQAEYAIKRGRGFSAQYVRAPAQHQVPMA